MKKYSDSIREHINTELSKSAMSYLREGLDMFHRVRQYSLSSIQPSAGNLGISIELMLKALLAKHNPLFVFKALPTELQLMFVCPESLPKEFNWRIFDIELRSFKYEMKELDECIPIFYVVFPEHKQELSAHFKLLARIRNASVHSILPSFQKYDLERLAYLALKLFAIAESTGALITFALAYITKEDKAFLSVFDKERIERVKSKVEEAKKKSKDIAGGKALLSIDGWESHVTDCPICGSEGVLSGSCDAEYDSQVGEDTPDEILIFSADYFICEDCGLRLDDAKELELAGMDTIYDISHKLDSWHKDHYEPESNEYM